MKFSKLFIILFASLLVLMTNCASKKTVHLTIKVPTIVMMGSPDKEITETYQFIEKAAKDFSEKYTDANVVCDVVCFPITEENDYIPGCFDTADAVDVLYEGYFNMSTYIHTGRVVPLDDIITDEIKNDIDEASWQMSRVGEKTYMMPFLSLQNILGYNKRLFRKAGLQQYISDENVIQNWSPAEWNFILSNLKANLPADTFPSMMYARNEQGDTHTMTFLRCRGSDFYDAKNYFFLDTPSGIAALQWIRSNYEKGYYPTHCELLEIVDASALFTNEKLAIYLINNSLLNNFPNLDLGFVNFPSVKPNGLATSFLTGFEVFDNGDDEKVQVGKAFVKFIYETPQWLEYSSEALPASKKVAKKYADKTFMMSEFHNNIKNTWNHTANNPNWRGVRATFYPHIQDLFASDKSVKQIAEEIEADCNAAIAKGWKESKLHE